MRRIADAQSHRQRTTCRLCTSPRLELVLSLAPTPPANALVTKDLLGRAQPCFPLDLYLCRACGHVQLCDVVDPGALFENYVYTSGASPAMVEHLKQQADYILERQRLRPGALVVEIGSNDGTLLRFFKQAGMRVLGVDPSGETSRRATAAGLLTLDAFFTPQLAAEILARHGPAAVVCANNVCAHIDDLQGVMRGVRTLLGPEGVLCLEVSYLLDVVQKGLFDTIYHEHLDYHHVGPMRKFLERCGMVLVHAERIPTQGGSIRLIAAPHGTRERVQPSVRSLEVGEIDAGLTAPETYRQMADKIDRSKHELTTLLRRLKKEGKKIAGLGAPAKATTLMYEFGLGPKTLDFIVDDSPLKQGLYTPGLHVPIVGPEQLYIERPSHVVVLAWNFADSIITRHRQFLRDGGTFIVPLPELRIVLPPVRLGPAGP